MDSETEAPPKLRRYVLLIYLLGCGFWLIVWHLVGGYEFMSYTLMLWLPFLSCFIIMGSNMLLWCGPISYEKYDVELDAIKFVETNAAHMVTAIAGTLVIAAAISAIKNQTPLPKEFIVFQSVAFICAVVGVLPLYWVPSRRVNCLVMLRHLKTVPFTYAISLFLAGLLRLLYWL